MPKFDDNNTRFIYFVASARVIQWLENMREVGDGIFRRFICCYLNLIYAIANMKGIYLKYIVYIYLQYENAFWNLSNSRDITAIMLKFYSSGYRIGKPDNSTPRRLDLFSLR